ncbi:cytochrome c oxidase subunit II [Vreelandella utahensis]|uniref:cytochrome c oxidase subunit II n=1 Tax=Vreelandella halophila TaxID=86177 RepID=UPI000985FC80|nr:cytochrome c oxidase subunit II [Halomonas utahensis]
MSVQALRAGALATAVTAPSSALAGWGVNLPEGVTSISNTIYDIHMWVFWICVAIGVGVFLAILWSVLAYRHSKGAKPAHFHENTTVELIWTVIPFLILIMMAIPATGTLVDMYDTSDAEMEIKVTGYQWRWQYEYMDEDISFFSSADTPRDAERNLIKKTEDYKYSVDNPLVLPVDTKIRFLITSNDVIHSWWVPEFGWKQDAIPGFINKNWAKIEEPGTYYGLCAELCGQGHSDMPIEVKAVPKDDYREWVAEQTGEDG